MKYRRLTLEELEAVTNDFIAFLAVNGLDPAAWEKLKSDTQKTTSLIEEFSDVWFQTYLSKIQFVDVDLSSEILSFRFTETEINLIGVRIPENIAVNDLGELISDSRIKLFSTTRNDFEDREMEIFRLLESGGRISDGHRFKDLYLAWADSQLE
ncbi:MAG: hypothetical protein GC181_05345 [Bacteroidetes bacterium]|nr:hypothetical protein [Bacteroidota bacterium]